MNISIKDRMKKFLPGKVYKRFTGLISPCGDEYAALVLILEEAAIKAAEKVFRNHGRPRGSARRFTPPGFLRTNAAPWPIWF